jgi:hypothetical protein
VATDAPAPAGDSAAIRAFHSWRPSAGWADVLREPVRRLLADPADSDSCASLAMMLGDTHQAELCFIVCEFARATVRSGTDDSQLSAHQALAAWDLGLGSPDSAGVVKRDSDRVRVWLARELQPFGGQLRRAAIFSLLLAGNRLGLLTGPTTPTFDDLCDPARWKAAR